MQRTVSITTQLALVAAFVLLLIPVESSHHNHDGQLNNKKQAILSFLSKSSFARDKVIDLIVNEYTAISTYDEDASDWLDLAIEAMEFCETDGEPAAVEGYDFLFVGSVGEFMMFYCANSHTVSSSPCG